MLIHRRYDRAGGGGIIPSGSLKSRALSTNAGRQPSSVTLTLYFLDTQKENRDLYLV